MAEFNPLLFILAIVPIMAYLILIEYHRARKRYKINRNIVKTNYLRFFVDEGQESPKLVNTDDISIETHRKEDLLSSDYVEISPELLKFKFLMNPVRLGVIGLLFKYSDYQQSEIRKSLDISWGQFSSHVNSLEKGGYISIGNKFLEGKAVKMLCLTERGNKEFRELRVILKSIVHN